MTSWSKKNRFVHVSSQGVTDHLLKMARVPIVTANADHVSQFKRYVLKVTMASNEEPPPGMPPRAQEAFDVMILAHNLRNLCGSLMVGNVFFPGFAERVHLTLNLGSVVTASREHRDYENLESLESYFSEKTQKKILQPFRDLLYDMQNIRVCGLVSADVASSTCKDAASGKWDSPQNLLNHVAASMEFGARQIQEGEVKFARGLWLGNASEINMLRTRKDWPRFVQEGGDPFIAQLAKLFFRLNLTCAILFMDSEGDGRALQLAQHTLRYAHLAMTTGHWKEGFTWQPPRELRAELHWKVARYFRLKGDITTPEEAASELEDGLLICPNHPDIERELRLLLGWVNEAARGQNE